jgi:hypothetical protein
VTDDKLRDIANFYKELCEAAGAVTFLKNCSLFTLHSGSRICTIPNGLQDRISALVKEYYEELKEKQKEL